MASPPAPVGSSSALFGLYKPAEITDEEWECWMFEYLTSWPSPDNRAFNSWWVARVKSDILRRLARPAIISKVAKKKGRWKRLPGLAADDVRPEYIDSITTHGGLFFETPFGVHREFVPDPGRKFDKVGHFIILWNVDSEAAQGKITCAKGTKSIPRANFYNGMATTYAMVEEAERRGYLTTLIVFPRGIEMMWDAIHDTEEVRETRQDIPAFPIRSARTGQPMYDMNVFDVFANYGVGADNILGKFSYASFVRAIPSINSGEENPRFTINGRKAADAIRESWQRYKWPGTPNIDESSSGRDSEVSQKFIWVQSKDYADIKDTILAMSHSANIRAAEKYPLELANYFFAKMRHTVRGSLIIVTHMPFPNLFHIAWRTLQTMDEHLDIFFFDLGPNDLSGIFKRPEYQKHGRTIVKYVYIGNDIEHLTERVVRATGSTIDGIAL